MLQREVRHGPTTPSAIGGNAIRLHEVPYPLASASLSRSFDINLAMATDRQGVQPLCELVRGGVRLVICPGVQYL